MTIREKYITLKDQAKQALLAGEIKQYVELLNDIENFNFILTNSTGKR